MPWFSIAVFPIVTMARVPSMLLQTSSALRPLDALSKAVIRHFGDAPAVAEQGEHEPRKCANMRLWSNTCQRLMMVIPLTEVS
jgi:hypothetical protein